MTNVASVLNATQHKKSLSPLNNNDDDIDEETEREEEIKRLEDVFRDSEK